MASYDTPQAQDSKVLYEQQREFISAQANFNTQPGTSAIPLDPSSPTGGPSGYNQPSISAIPSDTASSVGGPSLYGQSSPIIGERPPSYMGPVRRTSTSFSNQASAPPIESIKEASWSKFEVCTKKLSLSSGFPYDDRLTPLRVSHEEWFQFSSEIGIAAKLTPAEDWAAWTAGITTGTFALPFLLVFAPTVGYKTGKSVHRKVVQSNVQKKLIGDGDLRNVFRKWNQNVFVHKGFQAWLELPNEEEEEEKKKRMKKAKKLTSDEKEVLRQEQETLKRFRILILPYDGMDIKPTSISGTRQASIPNFVEADANQAQTTTPKIPPLSEAPESEPEIISPLSPAPSTSLLASATSSDRSQTEGGGVRHEMAGDGGVRHEMAA